MLSCRNVYSTCFMILWGGEGDTVGTRGIQSLCTYVAKTTARVSWSIVCCLFFFILSFFLLFDLPLCFRGVFCGVPASSWLSSRSFLCRLLLFFLGLDLSFSWWFFDLYLRFRDPQDCSIVILSAGDSAIDFRQPGQMKNKKNPDGASKPRTGMARWIDWCWGI